MKKLTGIMMALLLVIGFTMAATAAEMDVTCENCPKAVGPGIINIGQVSTTQETGTISTCIPFDYETASGYCPNTAKDNRVIFTLCDCTRGTFNANDEIPLRLTVLTDGVYWVWENGGVASNAIATMLRYMVDARDCPTDFPSVGGTIRTTDVVYTFTLEDGTMYQTQIDETGALVALDAYGTPIVGAPQGVSLLLDTDGTIESGWCGSATCSQAEFYNSPSSSNSCDLSTNQHITSITVNNVYTLTDNDVYNNLQKFQINLPSLRYDVDEIANGDPITVQIEYGRVVNCGPCFACECERTVGVLGNCQDSTQLCMYFPFVFTDMAPWDTGIVITNLSTAAKDAGFKHISATKDLADMVATFVYTDSTGAEFSYTKSDFDQMVWPFMMGGPEVLPNLNGTPQSGPGWLRVITNFEVDGYQFVTNGDFGGSTQPRGCCALCY